MWGKGAKTLKKTHEIGNRAHLLDFFLANNIYLLLTHFYQSHSLIEHTYIHTQTTRRFIYTCNHYLLESKVDTQALYTAQMAHINNKRALQMQFFRIKY